MLGLEFYESKCVLWAWEILMEVTAQGFSKLDTKTTKNTLL